jgi:hypothetical protein
MRIALAALALSACVPAFAQDKAAKEPEVAVTPEAMTPDKFHELVQRVTFYRGAYAREITGYSFAIPKGWHLADNADARRLESGMGRPDDQYLAAWIVAESSPLTQQSPIVRVRWRGDGLVQTGTIEDISADLLVAFAEKHTPEQRLVSSPGKFQHFVAPPLLDNKTAAWVEERADASNGSVFDCHAVHLSRRGFLEFSMIGVDANTSKTCAATLRMFTDSLKFDPARDYPAAIEGVAKAPYNLAQLITQTK